MPMFCKLDVFRIVERRDGAIYKTKKVAYHWFRVGQTPPINKLLSAETIEQNKLPPGDYVYASTLDYIADSRCPAGGIY